ncbi:molybdopterin cofactor-binding domain-containing protein [Luminiphilus sp. nBUS_16]|uniref:xanthine dehydrogenase family protein molybdopterin-binding subunit n=1 Tax=Luminiphilus sp. nBUS_16 TaxID=3395315 RepID=UPI003EC01B69
MSSAIDKGMKRRDFIRYSSFGLALSSGGITVLAAAKTSAPANALNPYVVIHDDGRIVIAAPNPDVGQGVNTALPMIVAEELDADWEAVEVVLAPIDATRYGAQFAGGSLSVRNRWNELRQMGAAAREMLLRSAAQQWRVPRGELTTQPSKVIHPPSGRSASFAELVAAATEQPVPGDGEVVLKARADYRLLGQRIVNAAAADIVRGRPIFGIDVAVPDMVYATYVKCPQIGGVPKAANLDEVKALPGILDAFIVAGDAGPPSFDLSKSVHVAGGIAIVASNTWAGIKARRSLKIDWDVSAASTDNSLAIEATALKAAQRPTGAREVKSAGDPQGTFANASRVVSGVYATDFVSHAQLEPQSCVANVSATAIEVWTSSQTPGYAQATLAKLFELPAEAITVHQVRGGGGFGRRLSNEYVREAAVISKHIGKPVKLQWMREDDMAFDFYRSPAYFGLQATLSETGALTGWRNHVVSVSSDGEEANYGAGYRGYNFPDDVVPNIHVSQTLVASKTPTGAWRAPISNVYAFAEQSFLHELAEAAGKDHRDFLMAALGEDKWFKPDDLASLNTVRAREVIAAVTRSAGWGRVLPEGRGLGLSFFFSHAGHVAEVAEVSVSADRAVTVHEVWVAADLGQIVNLSGAENQFQGSIVDGLSALADQRISISSGAIEQTNFHQYPLLRMPQSPKINVEFLASDYPPSGAGEPALPPVAPAVCNAVFSACGERIRNLPISRAGFSVV